MKSHSKSLLQGLIIAVFLLFCLCFQVCAQQAELEWDPDASQVAGYNVHYGVSTRNYTTAVNAGANTTCTLQSLSGPAYFIAVTAYDSNNNESAFSPELIIYSMAASAGTGGSITPAGTFFKAQGDSQTFTITPTAGNTIADVQVDGSSVGAVTSYTLSNIASNHTISATFSAQVSSYKITATTGSNGSISPSGSVTVTPGAAQTFTVSPATGYQVSSVLVDGNSVGAVTTYTFSNVTANHTISATFALTSDTITPSAGPNGSISPSTAVTVNFGAAQTFTVSPATGYQVSSVLVDGNSVGAVTTYTFSNVTANHTISATFALTSNTITPSAGPNGSISPSTAVTVNSGAAQTFTVSPATGYQVSSVLVDGNSVGAVTTYTFSNVTASHTIAATFAKITYTISTTTQDLTSTSSGSISPSGTVSVPSGTSKTFKITPSSNNKILGVLVDGVSVGAVSSYTFTNVTANHTIAATFERKSYRISATAQGSGSMSPMGTTNVSPGTDKAYTITPAAHYQISNVKVDGNAVGASVGKVLTHASTGRGSIFTFTNVNDDHTIEVLFSKIPPPVADAGPDQTVSTISPVTLDGSNSTDTVVGIASYRWTQVSGHPVALSNPYGPVCTFTAPNTATASMLAFKLTVTNNGGVAKTDSCLVNVSANDQAPLANAGPGQTVQPASIVNLNGSGSSDPDGTIASYKWVQVEGPSVQIVNANSSQASFMAPDPGPLGASLVFQVQVADHLGLTTRDQCTVNVTTNTEPPPFADAGRNQNAVEGFAVTLDGTGSQAQSAITYRWKQIRGLPVTLSDPSQATPVFTAPSNAGVENADLVFMLTVTDADSQLSATAECSVTIASQ